MKGKITGNQKDKIPQVSNNCRQKWQQSCYTGV